MTKEGIVTKYSDSRFNMPMPFNGDGLDKMLDEYAQQEAIGFAEWTAMNLWVLSFTNMWYKKHSDDYETYTTEQLYKKYREENV